MEMAMCFGAGSNPGVPSGCARLEYISRSSLLYGMAIDGTSPTHWPSLSRLPHIERDAICIPKTRLVGSHTDRPIHTEELTLQKSRRGLGVHPAG